LLAQLEGAEVTIWRPFLFQRFAVQYYQITHCKFTVFLSLPQHIFSFFQLIYISFMEAVDKTTLFRNLLFRSRKEEISKNRLRLGVGVLSSEYTFVLKLKKKESPISV
jgi:hypothetical protein